MTKLVRCGCTTTLDAINSDHVAIEAIRRPCWPKIPHETRERAVQHLIAQARMDTTGHVERLAVYTCRACGHFHVGHAKNNTRGDLKKGLSMATYYDDLLKRTVEYDEQHDEQTAKRLVRKAASTKMVCKATPEELTVQPSSQDTSATSEFEALLGQRLSAHPEETRAVATVAVLAANPDLFAKYRAENTWSDHGATLGQIQQRASASFGVDHRGNPVAKAAALAEVNAIVMRKAAMVLTKCSTPVSMERAIAAVFQHDPDLFRAWRAATY
jgi:hypothetical protein